MARTVAPHLLWNVHVDLVAAATLFKTWVLVLNPDYLIWCLLTSLRSQCRSSYGLSDACQMGVRWASNRCHLGRFQMGDIMKVVFIVKLALITLNLILMLAVQVLVQGQRYH